MENRKLTIKSKISKNLEIDIIPGHFATNHSHINYYIDMTSVKHKFKMAKEAAYTMAQKHVNNTIVNTIICMDGCEVIGAFLARELTKAGFGSMNEGSDICVVTPEFNSNGQMIFRDNIQGMLWNKNIILLLASATTGKTINRSLECIKYYGGKVISIDAIFSAIDEMQGIKISSLFTQNDILDYKTFSFVDCPYCREKNKIDAIVNSYGYSKI